MGIYETAIDFLCSEGRNSIVKYIGSTATIRRADDQVQAVFQRDVRLFPPHGLSSDDKFFIRDTKIHPLNDNRAGRLYLGVCAPGRGPLTPIVRIWSRLLQTAYEHREDDGVDIDPYWTLTGYFNAIRELGGVRALYRQDIPQRMDTVFGDNRRRLNEDNSTELSGRKTPMELPGIFDILNKSYPDVNSPDALFTTSMFGTGVDISRIGLMVVHGQPKTTSSYIQSTGRVGRRRGALVVTFLRASRPRDLNHYEFFCGYHSQLHRFVEPVTVYPFSPGVIDRSIGPVGVFILRNMGMPTVNWCRNDSSANMQNQRTHASEVLELPNIMESRAQHQPVLRRLLDMRIEEYMNQELDRWHSIAVRNGNNLKYVEYVMNRRPVAPVVLGDLQHQHANLDVVYENTPQSLRDIEETTGFQTESGRRR